MNLASAVISAAIQLLLFTLIPFLLYLLFHRREQGFLRFIGLYRPNGASLALAVLVWALSTPLLLWAFSQPALKPIVMGPQTVAGKMRALGWSASSLGVLLVQAAIQTALAEEILFRGYIAKRLINWLGFHVGNTLQALLFGGLHLALYLTAGSGSLDRLQMTILLLPTTCLGWLLGYVKERAGNGSIIPGWLAHTLSNAISFYLIAFVWT
jgi:membrane protease YdiL (CAAX protease family)